MTVHAERRVIRHRPQDLYDLVADVRSYPQFLPWCMAARIRHADRYGLAADLIIGFQMFRERFTSHVELNPEHLEIDVKYAEGPFKYLTNKWRFLPHPDGCEIHLVPHVISWAGGGVEDDHAASLALREEFPSVTVAPAFTSPSEAKSYIAGLDFFMGARMHACIAAFSSGVPVVPMAYSRKFAGLFGSLGYDETVDCTSLSAEEILARIFDAYGRRADLARTQKAALATGLEKLARYEAALGDLMEQLALRPEKPRARLP